MHGDVCRGVDHKWMCVKMGLQWGCLPTILGFVMGTYCNRMYGGTAA